MRKALWTAAAALILSLAFMLLPGFSAWFSGHISLPLASLISRATASGSWPVGEVMLLAGAPVLILLLLWSAVRRRAPRGPAFALALVFLVYAVLWVPLCHVPAMEVEPYETWRLMKLSRTLADQAESLNAAFAASRACFYGLPPDARYGEPAALLPLLAALRDREKLRARPAATPPLARAA